MKSLADELGPALAGTSFISARGSWTGQQALEAAGRLAAWLEGAPAGPLISRVADAASTAVTALGADLAGRPVMHIDPAGQAPIEGVVVSESPVACAGYLDEMFGLYGIVAPYAGSLSGVPERSHLFLTSGSTGTPVGVVRSAEAVMADALRVVDVLRYRHEPNILVSAPVHHVYGFNYGLIAPMAAGSAIYYSGPRVIPSQLARAIKRHRSDTLIGHPALYRMLAGDDQSALSPDVGALKRAVSAGAALPAGSAASFTRRYRVNLFNCYGSSEAGAVTLSPVTGNEEAGNAGFLLDGIDARIAAGELLLRTDSLAAGYLSADGLIPLKLAGEWYRTGDLVDLAGREVRLRGRVADVINVAGEKVIPLEIETVLLAHPLVVDAEVHAEPDPARGSVPVALVTLSREIDMAELVRWCWARLDPHKVPRRIDVREEIVRTATGKRLRPVQHRGESDG